MSHLSVQDGNGDSEKYARCLISALEVRVKDGPKNNRMNKKIKDFFNSQDDSNSTKNARRDTPLILAVKASDLKLVKLFTMEGDSQEDSEEILKKILSEKNAKKKNALLVAIKMCVRSPFYKEPDFDHHKETRKVFKYLFNLVCNLSNCGEILGQTTNKRQHLLHLAFAAKCKTCNAFCCASKIFQQREKLCEARLDVTLEDFKHFTPLFYLIVRGFDSAELIDKKKQNLMIECASELMHIQRDAKKPLKSLLINSFGMDIAHACSRTNWFNDAFEALVSKFKTEFNEFSPLEIELYQGHPAQFSSQVVLGGPINIRHQEPQSPRQRPFKYNGWTALHFACASGHDNSIVQLLDRGLKLQDRTQSGHTCADLALERWSGKDAIWKALNNRRLTDENTIDQQRPRVLMYARNVDSVRCALDDSDEPSGDGELTPPLTTEAADKLLKRAWRRFKENIRFDSIGGKRILDMIRTPLICRKDRKMAKMIRYLYLCFENDSVSQYKALMYSSYWLNDDDPEFINCKSCSKNHLSDSSLIQFFLKVARNEHVEDNTPEDEVPKKERIPVKIDFIEITFERIFSTQKPSEHNLNKHVFSYRNNGRIFYRNMGKPDDYFMSMSMIDFAIITGRISMAKALLITQQFDLIPRAVATIIRCNRLIQKEQLINYYPIRDINVELKGMKAFAAKVAINAIDVLFRGCTVSETDILFEYLLGKFDARDSSADGNQFLPRSKLTRSTWDRKNNKTSSTEYSTLELIRKSNKEELYGSECIQQLVQRAWREPGKYLSSDINDVLETSPVLRSAGNDKTAYYDKQRQNCIELLKYLSSPRRTLLLNTLSTLLFICLLSTCLTFPSVSWNWCEILLIGYVLAYFVQEIHECRIRVTTVGEGFRSYILDVWNIYDLLNIFFLTTAFAYKGSRGGPWGDMDDVGKVKLADEAAIYAHFFYKILMSVSLLLASAKFLKSLRFVREIGVNVVIMPQIFYRDLLPFLIILFLMIASFGVAFMAVLTVGRYSFDQGVAKRRSDESMFEVYTRPFLSAFGEFQLDSLASCSSAPSNESVGNGCYFPYGQKIFFRFLLLIFLLIVNLVMFNMLIAKFSNTVSRYEKRSPLIWLAMRHELLIDYCRLSPFPPPFNIVSTLYLAIQHCRSVYRSTKVKHDPEQAETHQTTIKDKRCQKYMKAYEEFLKRQAKLFRKNRVRIRTRNVETIEDDIEAELLGEGKDLNMEAAAIPLEPDFTHDRRVKEAQNRSKRQFDKIARTVKALYVATKPNTGDRTE